MKGIKVLVATVVVVGLLFIAFTLGKNAGVEIAQQAKSKEQIELESEHANLAQSTTKLQPVLSEVVAHENVVEEVIEESTGLNITKEESLDSSLHQELTKSLRKSEQVALNDEVSSEEEQLRASAQKMFANFGVDVTELQQTISVDPHEQEPVDEEWALQSERLIREAAQDSYEREFVLQQVDCRTKACKIGLMSEQEDAFVNGVKFSELIEEQVWFDKKAMQISFEPISRNGVMIIRFQRSLDHNIG